MELLTAKHNGYQRAGPQDVPQDRSKTKIKFICDQCGSELESNGLLRAHLALHVEPAMYPCDVCNNIFETSSDLEKHAMDNHTKSKEDEWNCNGCAFQASSATELMNHLKITGHQPSKELDKKRTFGDYRKCFTCNMEFDGYYNLMNHRKEVHPSNRRCRNYPGNCTWAKECWYVHLDEPMDVDPSPEPTVKSSTFICNLCGEVLLGRGDFLKHKKMKHNETILPCQNFLRGVCSKSEETCWFKHSHTDQPLGGLNSSSGNQVFHKAPQNAFPPDQVAKMFQMMNNLFMKVEQMETKFQALIE